MIPVVCLGKAATLPVPCLTLHLVLSCWSVLSVCIKGDTVHFSRNTEEKHFFFILHYYCLMSVLFLPRHPEKERKHVIYVKATTFVP